MAETKKLIKLSKFREVAREMAAHEQEEYNAQEAERRLLKEAGRRAERAGSLREWCQREGVEYLPNSEGYLPIPGGWLIEASLHYGELLARVLGACPYCHEIVDPHNGRAWHRDITGIGSIIDSWSINPDDHECDSPDRPVKIVPAREQPSVTARLADVLMEVLMDRYPGQFS